MTYYPDLSVYEYGRFGENIFNIGWLDKTYNFPTGKTNELFIERLFEFCEQKVEEYRGYHLCNLCNDENPEIFVARYKQKSISLGNSEIRVFAQAGKVYAAPNLIYHYVVDHDYYPPEEFIQSVMAGPFPGSEEYELLANNFDWDRHWAMSLEESVGFINQLVELARETLTDQSGNKMSFEERQFYVNCASKIDANKMAIKRDNNETEIAVMKIIFSVTENTKIHWSLLTKEMLREIVSNTVNAN